MSDSSIATGAPVASPAPTSSPAPSETPSAAPLETTDTETLAVIGKAGEGEINRQWDDDQNPDLSESQRKSRRAQRYKAGRDVARQGEAVARQEAAELRAQLAARDASPDGTTGDVAEGDGEPAAEGYEEAPAPEATGYDPEQVEAARQALREQVQKEFDILADHRARDRMFAAQVPDFHETIAPIGDIDLPDHQASLVRESPYSAAVKYAWGKSRDGVNELLKFRQMSPAEATKYMAKVEAIYELGAQQQRAQSSARRIPTVSRAAPPMQRLVGSGTGPQSQLHAVNDFIKKTYGDRG
jgi:hypothetical protein